MSFNNIITTYEEFDFDTFFASISNQDIEKILKKDSLNHLDFLALLSKKAQNYLEDMAYLARKKTIRHFGKTVQLYMPIYISNYCTNECVYCGFNKSNHIKRKHLTEQEIEQEAIEIAKTGVKHILLLTGEAEKLVNLEYIKSAVKILKKYFDSVSIEIYPLETTEYKELKELGVDGLTIYQETYNKDIYDEVHLSGKKKDYLYRLNTPERGAEAGLRQIGIGALFGLGDIQKEAFFSGLHGEYLIKKFMNTEISLSLPRITTAAGKFIPKKKLDDKTFVQFMLAFRLFLPMVGLNVSTREKAEFRDNLIGIGITKFSAGSKTDVGGYQSEDKSTAQFETSDKRSVKEIDHMIKNRGYQPVYKDWELMI